MTDQNEIQNVQSNINEYVEDMRTLISSVDKKTIKNISVKLIKFKEKLMETDISSNIARGAIILLVLNYKTNSPIFKIKKVKDLLNELIDNFSKNDIIQKSLKDINDKFKEPSPIRTMISFRKKIKQEKEYLELYFKIMMINQNSDFIIEGINSLLGINNENILNLIRSANFKNPYSILVVRELLNELLLIENQFDEKILLETVLNDFKNHYIIHCPNCLGILYVNTCQSISLTCVKCSKGNFVKNLNELKNSFNYDLKCNDCQQKLEIFKDNYKCIECNHFFCQKCAIIHEKGDVDNILIHIYEVANICEKHCELFTTFCGLCKMNLCNICKQEHFHRVDKKVYELDNAKLEKNYKQNLDNISNINDFISIKLSHIFEFMSDFSYNNLFIKLPIWFMEENLRKDEIKDNDFYFKKFFDKDFQKYYSSLLSNILNGKSGYYPSLLDIKKRYEKIDKKVDESFSAFQLEYQDKKFERASKIRDWISDAKEILLLLEFNNDILGLNNEIIELKNKSLELESDINLLKIKILALLNSNELYCSFLIKLINRYLCDFLIRKLIEKYPSDFQKIEISPKNFFEIALNFNDILNNIDLNDLKDKLNLEELIEDLNKLEEEKADDLENKKEEKIKSFIKNLKDNNKIMFINDIKIKDNIYKANELNFVLETFFYFKSQGNIIAHINISVNDAIKLKKINAKIESIKSFLNIENNKDNSKNIEIKLNDTKEKKSNSIINIDSPKIEINNNNEIKFHNDNEGMNSFDYNKIISEQVIQNINHQKKDWLEIENDISQGVNDLIKEIKDKIICDFYETSVKDKLNINDIIDFLFKKDYENMFQTNSSFTRALSQSIDELIQKKQLNTNFSKLDKIKNIISKLSTVIESIDDLIDNYKDLKIQLNNNVYKHINIYINEYIKNKYYNDEKKLENCYLKIIKDLFKKSMNPINMDELESKSLVISLIIPIIKSQELNNSNNFISNLRESFKKYYILDNTKSLLNDLYKTLENLAKTQNNDNPKDLFSEIKEYIQKYKSSSNVKDMSYEKFIKIIKELFGKKSFDWTKMQKSEISLESLLFYYQNN